MKQDIKSALFLDHMVFDSIIFKRLGFKNENELEVSMKVQISENVKENKYKVQVCFKGDKKDEYEFEVVSTGFFHIEKENMPDKVTLNTMLQKNAVSILIPYIRSEISLLTAQPETETVVLPPLNVSRIIDNMIKLEQEDEI